MQARRLFLIALGLLMVPELVDAQRRRRGDRPNYDGVDLGAGAMTVSARDVENISPIKVLVDKRKDLALSEDQVKQLRELDAKVRVQNDSLFRQLDSLRKEMRPNSAASPAVEQIRQRGVRSSVVAVVLGIRANYDAAEPAALALLDEQQQLKASEMLDKEQQAADASLMQKLGGGRRGGGG